MNSLTKVGNVSEKSVLKHTGHNWSEWLGLLNVDGAQHLDHKEIVHLLKQKYRLSVWWQQEVARGYQIITGKRIPQQTLKGTYTTTVTRSFNTTAKKLFDFLKSKKGIRLWLDPLSDIKLREGDAFEREGEVFGEIRVVSLNKKIRLNWIDSEWPKKTTVQIHLVEKPSSKCLLVIDHIDLPTLIAKKRMHSHWRNVVDAIQL